MAAQYKLHAKSYIGGLIYDIGAVVEFDKNPGASMEPMNDEAWAKVRAQAEDRNKKGQAPLKYLWTKDLPTGNPVKAVASAPGWRKPNVVAED
jgi:hypothetical protein